MKKKPGKHVVGVMPLWDDEKDSIWMLPGYMDGLHQAGAVPIIFPFSTDETELAQIMESCDGFLFTGGHDVSPRFYHEEPMDNLVSSCEKRDMMEAIVLRIAMEADKPVLGICRGIQFINVALGGTLYQDLPLQHPSATNHHGQAPYDKPVHDIKVRRDSPLYDCLGMEHLPVNSYHHQAVKDVAKGLEVMATAPDGIVEALYKPDQCFLWAVQWHPEFSYKTDENSRKVFSTFVKAMKKNTDGGNL